MSNADFRCSRCGHFIGYDEAFDSYTPWGGALDLEPPDDEYLCAKCSTEEEEEMVAKGRVYPSYRPSRAEENAMKRLASTDQKNP